MGESAPQVGGSQPLIFRNRHTCSGTLSVVVFLFPDEHTVVFAPEGILALLINFHSHTRSIDDNILLFSRIAHLSTLELFAQALSVWVDAKS